MKCLRCGHCCQNYLVVVVDDPEKGPVEGNLKAIGVDGSERCPHLVGDTPGEFKCAVHDRPWYPETPCYSHTQIEQGDTNCRLGEYVLSNAKALC